ncbi:hydrogenase nickel incorporation protein HypB [Methylotenera sp.]|uniref:hydrogenase nickel incorporation protein HypB n=1 Tax=Methylotenera sp. TaxID=2051956 RepID=UPI00272FBE18|nr:hydrogenase nickel incorporation protein HypB [Methylotenera sp.]MDP2072058.1 hydrogenase nickel incorporation protein HypB [Methylotenera sp.]MDP3006932.1 hydrogenase nickel incorporation protein HypB [Methylotenera sp.]MDP3007131.1 hydrogenase nickel incorporation protein HypB [Methylotenera sp.]
MCATCGCGSLNVLIGGRRPVRGQSRGNVAFRSPKASIDVSSAEHEHLQLTEQAVDAVQSRVIQVERDLFAKNDALASNNRDFFAAKHILALNLLSSPGSGKTTLLVRTLNALKAVQAIAVIEGDQQTDNDAERIRATGVDAIQINTGKGCHLDASMVGHALKQLDLQQWTLLFIENVGNLVCPAAFDLGEAAKVVVLSVTEGEDKPLKYPDMFRAARLMLLNKCDLLPYLNFDIAQVIANAQRVNPDIEIIQLSATNGEGMYAWLAWIANAQHALALK